MLEFYCRRTVDWKFEGQLGIALEEHAAAGGDVDSSRVGQHSREHTHLGGVREVESVLEVVLEANLSHFPVGWLILETCTVCLTTTMVNTSPSENETLRTDVDLPVLLSGHSDIARLSSLPFLGTGGKLIMAFIEPSAVLFVS